MSESARTEVEFAKESSDLANAMEATASAFAAVTREGRWYVWENLDSYGLPDETRAALAALGYVSGAAEGDPFDHSLPDPVDRIGDLALLDQRIDLKYEPHLLGTDLAVELRARGFTGVVAIVSGEDEDGLQRLRAT